METVFFIGDAFMLHKKEMSQTTYAFMGARKSDSKDLWLVSIQASMVNGYAGGGSMTVWDVSNGDELRVSGNMKGFLTFDGLNAQKIKQKPIRAIKFIKIERDMVLISFIE